jgi:hypothetical protein
LQVVAVLSAALSEEVAGQLNRRKPRASLGITLGRKASTTSTSSQPKGETSTQQPTPSASGALLSDRTSAADVETSTPCSNSSSIEARSRTSKPAAAAASSSGSINRQEEGGADAVPAAQGCGCVIC